MSILNDARLNTEKVIDFLYVEMRSLFEKKPRDYRQVAHKEFISYTKKRKPRNNIRRKAIRKQLGYLKLNIAFIDGILEKIELEEDPFVHFNPIPTRRLELYETIKTVYEQQQYMYGHNIR